MSEQIRRKYHRAGLTSIYKCPKNHVNIAANTSLQHAQAVVMICWRLRKKGHDFITEAVPNARGRNRRIDIVDLTTGEEIEVEHTGKFKKGTTNYKLLTQERYEKLCQKKNVSVVKK